MNFAYVVAVFFAVCGLLILFYDIPALLLYHNKMKAVGTPGGKYDMHPHKQIGKYGAIPKERISYTKAVFTYDLGGKKVMATAVNLVGDDNTFINKGQTYTIKGSPFDPPKCYLPPIQLYRKCSIPAKVFIFIKRLLPKAGAVMFLGIAWLTYINFINV